MTKDSGASVAGTSPETPRTRYGVFMPGGGMVDALGPLSTCIHRWTDWGFFASASNRPGHLETRCCMRCSGEEFRSVGNSGSVPADAAPENAP